MEDREGICKLTFDYFVSLFASAKNHLLCLQTKLLTEFQMMTIAGLWVRPFSCEEFKEATFQMLSDKALDSYVSNPEFYCHFWNILERLCLLRDASGSRMVFTTLLLMIPPLFWFQRLIIHEVWNIIDLSPYVRWPVKFCLMCWLVD